VLEGGSLVVVGDGVRVYLVGLRVRDGVSVAVDVGVYEGSSVGVLVTDGELVGVYVLDGDSLGVSEGMGVGSEHRTTTAKDRPATSLQRSSTMPSRTGSALRRQ